MVIEQRPNLTKEDLWKVIREKTAALNAHDETIIALRAQLDTSMQTQETLAKNVNDGLLKIRTLQRQLITVTQERDHLEQAYIGANEVAGKKEIVNMELQAQLQAREATMAELRRIAVEKTDLATHLSSTLGLAEQTITRLEQALRLYLAVAPDDPVLIEPIEQRVVRLEGALKAIQQTANDSVGNLPGL